MDLTVNRFFVGKTCFIFWLDPTACITHTLQLYLFYRKIRVTLRPTSLEQYLFFVWRRERGDIKNLSPTQNHILESRQQNEMMFYGVPYIPGVVVMGCVGLFVFDVVPTRTSKKIYTSPSPACHVKGLHSPRVKGEW